MTDTPAARVPRRCPKCGRRLGVATSGGRPEVCRHCEKQPSEYSPDWLDGLESAWAGLEETGPSHEADSNPRTDQTENAPIRIPTLPGDDSGFEATPTSKVDFIPGDAAMAITLQCSCGQRFRANEAQLGKTFSCPKCGRPNAVAPRDHDAPSPQTRSEPPLDFDGSSVTSPPSRLPPPHGQRASQLPLVLSVAALFIALTTAAWSVYRNPLGAGISAYDFTTPPKAIDSSLAITLNADIRAMMDLQRLKDRHAKEKRATLKIHRDADYEGKKILFISFKEDGITQRDTEAFEKHADTGLWFPAYVSEYDMDDAVLKLAIEAWKNKVDGDSE